MKSEVYERMDALRDDLLGVNFGSAEEATAVLKIVRKHMGAIEDDTAGDGGAERVYCENCASWRSHERLPAGHCPDTPRCAYLIGTNPDHPIRPEKVYASPEVQNCKGECKYYKDRQEGLGIAAQAGKRSADRKGVMGDGMLLMDDEEANRKN